MSMLPIQGQLQGGELHRGPAHPQHPRLAGLDDCGRHPPRLLPSHLFR